MRKETNSERNSNYWELKDILIARSTLTNRYKKTILQVFQYENYTLGVKYVRQKVIPSYLIWTFIFA